MMNQMKKLIAALLVITLVFAMAGCGSKEDDTKPTSTVSESKTEEAADEAVSDNEGDVEAEDLFAEKMTLTIGYWGAGDSIKDDDPVRQMIEEKFNVELVGVSVGWDNYKEKFKLWAAAGELPDIFATDEINSKTHQTWIEQGVIRSLPADLSAYPNVEAAMSQPDVLPLKVDGEFYMIPRLTYPSTDMWRVDRGVLIRKDWLANLGLETPTTFEDFKTVLTAFVGNDPDGNGENDTVGLTHKQMGLLEVLFMGSVPQVTNGSWINEDGKWIPAYYSKNMVDGVAQMKELYQEGLLDPDFVLLKDNDGVNKFTQGKAGILATQVSPGALKSVKDKWIEYGNDADSFADSVALIGPWAHADGNTYSFTQTTYWSESYFSSMVDDAKMDRILRIYDYLKSPEFTEIKSYGIEGVDFEKDDDAYTILLEKNEDGTYPSVKDKYPSLQVLSYLAAWDQQVQFVNNELNSIAFGEDVMNMASDYIAYSVENQTPTPVNFEAKLLRSPAKSEISTIVYMDDVIKVILSDGDVVADWQAVRDEYVSLGIEAAIEEITALAAEKGIE